MAQAGPHILGLLVQFESTLNISQGASNTVADDVGPAAPASQIFRRLPQLDSAFVFIDGANELERTAIEMAEQKLPSLRTGSSSLCRIKQTRPGFAAAAARHMF